MADDNSINTTSNEGLNTNIGSETVSQQSTNNIGVNTVSDEILDTQQPASFMESLLWYCAGADSRILLQCMNSDRVKYQGLGGIVLATGILAFVAMTFAINVIFFKGEWNSKSSVIISFGIGLLWGLIIFNLDRFIVSSTGKGDGTEKITSSEIIGALPRILMALVIAFSISAPLEIVIFEEEINKRFAEINEDKIKVQKEEFEKSNASDIKIIEDNLQIKLAEKAEQDAIYSKNEALVAYEVSHGGCHGKCEEFKVLRDNADKKSNYLKIEIDKLEDKRNVINQDRDHKLAEFKSKMNEPPALLERLLLLEEIPGSEIPVWLLRFLFIVIEVGPLFFKMMLTKSTYDHLKHHYDEMVLARYGIFEDESMVPGNSDGIAEKFYVYGNVSLLQHQSKITLNEQQRIDQQVLAMWQNYISKEMTDNPQRFITWLQQNIVNNNPESTIKENNSPNNEPNKDEKLVKQSTDSNKINEPTTQASSGETIPQTQTVILPEQKQEEIVVSGNDTQAPKTPIKLINKDGTETEIPDPTQPLNLVF
jgi:hypothetical protein